MHRSTETVGIDKELDGVAAQGSTRRRFLKRAALGIGGVLLAACGAPPSVETPTPAPAGAATSAPTTAPAATAAGEATAVAPATAAATAAATTGAAAGLDVGAAIAPTAAARPDGWKAKLPAPPKKYDPVVTITQNFALNGATKFINNESVEDNVTSRWLKQELGIYYQPKWAAQSSDAVSQNWATSLASGDLPEFMVLVSQENYARLKRADQLEDITEMWDKLASPAVKQKKEYPNGPLWRRFKQKDGSLKIDAIPWSPEVATNDTILWYRKDWLDKVGMQVPKTLDEVAAAASAFKKQGLAKIGINLSKNLRDPISGLDFVFAAYGVMPTYWVKGDGGKLVYGSIQPGIKDALAVLRKWYADGLFSQEFVTIDGGKSTEAVAANQVGLFTGPYWIPNWPLPDARKNDPNAVWTYADNPAGPNGRRGRALSPLGTNVQAFLKGVDKQKIEAVIMEMNWNMERFLASFETQDYWNCPCQGYGMIFEGYDYAWEGSKLVLGPSGTTGPWAYEGGREHTWLYANVLKDYFDNLAQVQAKGADKMSAMEKYLALDPVQKENADAYNLVYKTLDTAIANEFTGASTPTMLQAATSLKKLEAETMIGIVTGQKPLDAFDQFVKDWQAQGGTKIAEEVNAWAAGA